MKKLWDCFWELLPWISIVIFIIAYIIYTLGMDFISSTLMLLALANTALLIATKK
jgi:hypothetical protein